MHLLNRVSNKITCAVEVSSHMAALALLGAPAEYVSCPFQKVFVQEAATYSTNHRDFADCIAELDEFRDLPGDEWMEEAEEIEEGVTGNAADEDSLIEEGLFDEDFNPRLLECLGEEDVIDDDLRLVNKSVLKCRLNISAFIRETPFHELVPVPVPT